MSTQLRPGVDRQSDCPECGHPNVDAKFCDQCGTRIPQRRTCRACGHVDVDAVFCSQCGTRFDGSATINPYAPPADDRPEVESVGDQRLAWRWSRLGAAIIDSIALGIVIIPATLAVGFLRFDGRPVQLTDQVLAAILGFAIFIAVQGYFLLHGRTVGKRLVGLRMVDAETGHPAPFGRLLGLRYLPLQLFSLIPVVGPLINLVDIVMIFRPDRRCLHDHLANTKVVYDR